MENENSENGNDDYKCLMDDYKCLTVEDIVNLVKGDPAAFPLGLKTKVMSGDFEGNYTHGKHQLQYYETEEYGTVVCLGYEMHENFDEQNY